MSSSAARVDRTIFRKQALEQRMKGKRLDANLIRSQIFLDTLNFLEEKNNLERIAQCADNNLARWKTAAKASNPAPARGTLEVLSSDWGDAARQLTQKYGEIFAVLNMANAY